MKIPGAYCGEYGACGAAISCGIFMSVWNNTTPMSADTLGCVNMMTAKGLEEICKYPGPGCCKRVTFSSLNVACKYTNENTTCNLKCEEDIRCGFFKKNEAGCLKTGCEFYPFK